MTMTKKQSIPLKLWMDSAEEMRIISNKRASLIDLFKWLDYKQLNRIDTLQLFAVILVSIEGKPESALNSKYKQVTCHRHNDDIQFLRR